MDSTIRVLACLRVCRKRGVDDRSLTTDISTGPDLVHDLVTGVIGTNVLGPGSSTPTPRLDHPTTRVALLSICCTIRRGRRLLRVSRRAGRRYPINGGVRPMLNGTCSRVRTTTRTVVGRVALRSIISRITSQVGWGEHSVIRHLFCRRQGHIF